jgi:hypothetical protein
LLLPQLWLETMIIARQTFSDHGPAKLHLSGTGRQPVDLSIEPLWVIGQRHEFIVRFTVCQVFKSVPPSQKELQCLVHPSYRREASIKHGIPWAARPILSANFQSATQRDPASLYDRFQSRGRLLLFASCTRRYSIHWIKIYEQPAKILSDSDHVFWDRIHDIWTKWGYFSADPSVIRADRTAWLS